MNNEEQNIEPTAETTDNTNVVEPAKENLEKENMTPVEPTEPTEPTEPVEPTESADVAEAAAVNQQDESAPVDQPAQVVQPEQVEPLKAEEPEVPAGEMKWYVIQALTGKEDFVKQSIQQTIDSNPTLKKKVAQILVPTEETVEIKGGKRVEKVRKMFAGYVFLEMILDEESWYLIRQTHGVARFIGTKVQPTPVSEKEMQRVLKQLGKEERLEITFEKGEGIRIISGPFRGYTGTVDEVNSEKGKLKILVNIFGRDTPVEVNFEHTQKIS